jgi:ubiquinone/menaquinone biosynthesis C-methylase UbiE
MIQGVITKMTRVIRRAWRAVFDFNQYQRDRWVEAQAAKVPPSSRVLDVGAGSCPYRSFFDQCEYRAHDFGQLQPEQLLGRSGYGVIDYLSDILSIPVPDASFDVILCTEVLEHVVEPIRAIHELARILRPGGWLILTAPLGSGLHQEPHHFYGGYTPHWYNKVLAEAGFERIVIEPNGGFFKHYGQESQRFASLLAPRRGRRQVLWAPVWLLSLPWFAFICPLWAHLLDKIDRDKAFTVGYHVTAVRRY